MATKKYDVVAVTGQYTDKNGDQKNRYMNCGVVLSTDKGFRLKLEAMPVGSEGWFMLMEPRQQENNQGGGAAPSGGGDEPDIPFASLDWRVN